MPQPLAPGDYAPDFSALAVGGAYGDGQTVRLSNFRGKTVVIYFYPKDDTPGCTAQACSLRDSYASFLQAGAIVFGVSIDPPESHTKFIAKHGLPFPLISDEGLEIVQAYGVWIEKSKEGKTYMGTERSTFVIGPDGRIRSIFRSVKPEEHAETVIENLRSFEP
ncbi:MAG: thioredoxin-dependent thiol peroxidase [Terrimicrobiaceae bacterium]